MSDRVVIVEDHQLLAEMLAATLLSRGIDAAVVEPRATSDLVELVRIHEPTLVLLDLELGECGDATAMIPALVASGIRVLVVSGVVDRIRIAGALEAGAVGYQSKAAGFDALLAATEQALRTVGPLDPSGQASLIAELRCHRQRRERQLEPFAHLTDRESAALRALADGHAVREIASDWVVAEATVRSHVRGILTKLGVGSQLGAVAAAARTGWLPSASSEFTAT